MLRFFVITIHLLVNTFTTMHYNKSQISDILTYFPIQIWGHLQISKSKINTSYVAWQYLLWNYNELDGWLVSFRTSPITSFRDVAEFWLPAVIQVKHLIFVDFQNRWKFNLWLQSESNMFKAFWQLIDQHWLLRGTEGALLKVKRCHPINKLVWTPQKIAELNKLWTLMKCI